MPEPTKTQNKTYEHLTERQQSLTDAIALARIHEEDHQAQEIVELASERSGLEQYHPSMVSRHKNKFPDIIDERVQILSNRDLHNEEGEIITEGLPLKKYTGPKEGIDLTDRPGEQAIGDRPVKNTEEPQEEDEDGDKILLPANREIIFKIIRNSDEESARWVFNQLTGKNE